MKKRNKKKVIIFGAGPAGLAAATRLVENMIDVTVVEKEDQVGGISKTKEYKGYRFDLGGHRFFTKSDEVNKLWEETLGQDFITRPRLSRIYYNNKLFDYPVKAGNALKGLGVWQSCLVGFSYIKAKLFPQKEETNFEQWVSNRFGKRLYRIFFKTYTEKLWGIPCTEIQAEWAAQRIKGLSLFSALKNALIPDKSGKIKTLIDEFKYPKYGPGMMYEKMASEILSKGGNVLTETEVIKINRNNFTIKDIEIRRNNKSEKLSATDFISSMPITKLVEIMDPVAPKEVLQAARNLSYRSFITASVILKTKNFLPDTWIYVHSPEVKLGRIQNFKAWSPYMVPDKDHIALGLEYFCTEGDDLWSMKDRDLLELAVSELEKIGLGKVNQFVDGFVVRVPKAYPTYDSSYPKNIKVIKKFLTHFKNIQPIGRYGMFKYNNMDHSILTGLYAADNVLGSNKNIWEINADQEYHEESKKTTSK